MSIRLRLILGLLSIWALWAPGAARAAEPEGQWQEKTEIVFDEAAGKLVRRSFRAWDAHPELGLEFSWAPTFARGTAAGPIAGEGTLVWAKEGTALRERAGRYSTYTGTLENGRPHGHGKLTTRAGLIYDGAWKDGRMEGAGFIEYPTGERYRGNFRAGLPDGTGTYIAANGRVVDTSVLERKLAARDRTRLLGPAPRPTPIQAAAFTLADTGSPISISLYVDRAMNTTFKEADPEFESYVYGQSKSGDSLQIGLDAPDILARWLGDAPITASRDGFFLLEPNQFAPVFLVVDVVNDSDRGAQIVGGYVEVERSSTAWEPYLEITGIWYLAEEDAFDPTFIFVNEGWGPVQNAKITYDFGDTPGATYTIDAGTFDQSKEVSALPGMEATGADVAALKEARYPCPSYEQVPNCLTNLKRSGLFGALADHVYAADKKVYVQMTGAIDYDWTDANGALQHRRSPLSVELPLFAFVIGPVAEYGPPEAVNRKLPTIKLGLDGENYRIPLRYQDQLGAQQNKRFALTLDADKSSRHRFRVVLELADGTTVATPPADLLFFKPRQSEIY